jgi:hypothetical protein
MNTRNFRWIATPVAAFAVASFVLPAQAQRERPSREERREQRQERREDMTPEQRQQQWQQRIQNMTPEQRQRLQQSVQERMQQLPEADRVRAEEAMRNGDFATLGQLMGQGGGPGGQGGAGQGGWGGRGGQGNAVSREERQRQLMTASGINDPAIQDAVIQFVVTQEAARRPLLEMARQMSRNLANPEVTAEANTTALANFRRAAATDQTRYEAALKALDAQISYSTNPKIETFLTLIGILGNEVMPLGGPTAIFAQAGPGQGGRGQGQGGRGQGQGGRRQGGQGQGGQGQGGRNNAPAQRNPADDAE